MGVGAGGVRYMLRVRGVGAGGAGRQCVDESGGGKGASHTEILGGGKEWSNRRSHLAV